MQLGAIHAANPRSKVVTWNHRDMIGVGAAILNALGDQSADYIKAIAAEALTGRERLIIATHVPPYLEAALYRGKAIGTGARSTFRQSGPG